MTYLSPAHDNPCVGAWIGSFLVGSDQLVALGVSPARCTHRIDVIGWWPDKGHHFLCGEGSIDCQQVGGSSLESINPAFWGVLKNLLQALISQPFTYFELGAVHISMDYQRRCLHWQESNCQSSWGRHRRPRRHLHGRRHIPRRKSRPSGPTVGSRWAN